MAQLTQQIESPAVYLAEVRQSNRMPSSAPNLHKLNVDLDTLGHIHIFLIREPNSKLSVLRLALHVDLRTFSYMRVIKMLQLLVSSFWSRIWQLDIEFSEIIDIEVLFVFINVDLRIHLVLCFSLLSAVHSLRSNASAFVFQGFLVLWR